MPYGRLFSLDCSHVVAVVCAVSKTSASDSEKFFGGRGGGGDFYLLYSPWGPQTDSGGRPWLPCIRLPQPNLGWAQPLESENSPWIRPRHWDDSSRTQLLQSHLRARTGVRQSDRERQLVKSYQPCKDWHAPTSARPHLSVSNLRGQDVGHPLVGSCLHTTIQGAVRQSRQKNRTCRDRVLENGKQPYQGNRGRITFSLRTSASGLPFTGPTRTPQPHVGMKGTF